ncbi:MAG: MFS transporter [Deltaproteobacteria bacterium]|nr:MFS transporter [Deltaproteobacteria bacterium]
MRLRIFYGWWIVGACFLIAFYVSSVIFFGFTVFFEPLVREFGWSYTQISFASSLRGLEMGILSPLIGFLVDRFGSRRLLLAGTITVGIGLILLSYTQSLLMFYGAMLFMAFGAGGCTSVVTMTAVARWFRRDIGKALGIMSAGFGASGLMVPLIVWLVDACGWRTALIALGLGMWIIGIPLALVIRDSPEQYGYLPDGASSDDPAILNDPQTMDSSMTIWDVLKDRTLLCLNLAETVRFMALTSVVIHIMPHLSNVGTPRSTAGVIVAAIPLVSIIGRFALGWLGDVFDKRYITSLAFCLMGIGVFALTFVHMKVGLALFLLSFPAGFGGISVLRGTILREYYDPRAFGTMLGIMMGFAAVGGIIGPTLAGWAFDTFGNYQCVWSVFSLLLFLAIVLVLKIRPRVPQAGQ